MGCCDGLQYSDQSLPLISVKASRPPRLLRGLDSQAAPPTSLPSLIFGMGPLLHPKIAHVFRAGEAHRAVNYARANCAGPIFQVSACTFAAGMRPRRIARSRRFFTDEGDHRTPPRGAR
jgi:hypothetical protein